MTVHRMQMVHGWKKGEENKASVAELCVSEVCLKWPCVSSLEECRSRVESRPVSSPCSCCSVMLLALKTQTALCEPQAPLCWTCMCTSNMPCLFLHVSLASKRTLPRKSVVQTRRLCLWNQHDHDAIFNVWLSDCYIKNMTSAKYTCAVFKLDASADAQRTLEVVQMADIFKHNTLSWILPSLMWSEKIFAVL